MAYLIISQYNIWICPKSVLGPKPFGHQHFERSNPGDGDWAASQPHHKKGHIDQTMHVISCFRKHFLKSQGQYQRRTQFQKKVWSRFWQRKRTCHPPGLWRHGVPAFTLTNTGFYQAEFLSLQKMNTSRHAHIHEFMNFIFCRLTRFWYWNANTG